MERSSYNDAGFFLEICSGKGKTLNPDPKLISPRNQP